MARANACLIPAPGHLSANRVEVGGVEGVRAGGTFGRRPPPPLGSTFETWQLAGKHQQSNITSNDIIEFSNMCECGEEVDLKKWSQVERKRRSCQHGRSGVGQL